MFFLCLRGLWGVKTSDKHAMPLCAGISLGFCLAIMRLFLACRRVRRAAFVSQNKVPAVPIVARPLRCAARGIILVGAVGGRASATPWSAADWPLVYHLSNPSDSDQLTNPVSGYISPFGSWVCLVRSGRRLSKPTLIGATVRLFIRDTYLYYFFSNYSLLKY